MSGLKYTHKDGMAKDLGDFKSEYFKVNIPVTEEDFKNGNGEGIWVTSTTDGFTKWQNDSDGELIYVQVHNDPIYYDKMNYLDIISVETRGGGNRPVALIDELVGRYGKGYNPLNKR